MVYNSQSISIIPIVEDKAVIETTAEAALASDVTEHALAQSPQELALMDVDNRLSEAFKIPTGLEKRIGFWLDIYSKYDSKNYVIHHREFPWVVFEVVDATDIFKQPRNAKWLNRRDADMLAEAKKEMILNKLKVLSRRAHFKNLPDAEAKIFSDLESIPGSRKSVINAAIKSLRIQLGQKDMFESGLVNSAPYISMMEEVFADRGLPRELVRIPLVESSFNLEAESRVGALGVWQIMPNVAKGSMHMDAHIDERQSPLKSTIFAANMLKQNKRALKEWPLVVTSYNHGVGSMMKAVKKLKTYDLQQIIDRYNVDSFQFASSNFYACFMAALRAEVYSKELFPELVRPEAIKFEKLILSKSVSLDSLARKTGLTITELQESNADLPEKVKSNFKLPAGFQIYVPNRKEKEVDTRVQSATVSSGTNVN